MVTEGLWGWGCLTVQSRTYVLEWGRIPGGIGRVISEKSPTLGEVTDTGVIRYLGPGPNKRSRRFDTPTS